MYAPNTTIDQIIEALGSFISPFVPGAKIIRAQVNRTPMPSNPCVVLTELFSVDVAVPSMGYEPINSIANLKGRRKIDVQVDFYGALAGDYCAAIQNAIRTGYAFDIFPPAIKPLYSSDGVQSPLITAEKQWESRWTLTISMQYNPSVSVPQQFAKELIPGPLVPADL